MYYLLKEFIYVHDYDGWRITDDEFHPVVVFKDKNAAYQKWVESERALLFDIGQSYYDEYDDDFIDWVNQLLDKNFETFFDFHYSFEENPEFYDEIRALSDDDLMALLQKMKGNRYQVVELSEDELNQKRYVVGGYEDNYEPYGRREWESDNPPVLLLEKDELFIADKFNQGDFGYIIRYGYLFQGQSILTENDKNNIELKMILDKFPDIFSVDWEKGNLAFVMPEDSYHYSQDEIDALHQVNGLLKNPLFKLIEESYADWLV